MTGFAAPPRRASCSFQFLPQMREILRSKICFAENNAFITEQHLHWRAQVLINKGQSE